MNVKKFDSVVQKGPPNNQNGDPWIARFEDIFLAIPAEVVEALKMVQQEFGDWEAIGQLPCYYLGGKWKTTPIEQELSDEFGELGLATTLLIFTRLRILYPEFFTCD